jgi:hypothetical protein
MCGETREERRAVLWRAGPRGRFVGERERALLRKERVVEESSV